MHEISFVHNIIGDLEKVQKDSRTNSLVDLIRVSKATPNSCMLQSIYLIGSAKKHLVSMNEDSMILYPNT
jgi:hypothetical protein